MPWYRSTTLPTAITDMNLVSTALARLNTFFTDCAAEGASFLWTVASYQAAAPAHLVLKRKDGSAGRLMLFGGTAPAAAVLGPSVTATTTAIYVGYDRTATVDSPTTSYAVGLPFGGTTANWHLARGIGTLVATASQFRAYCSADANSLAWFWTGDSSNTHLGFFVVGNWLRNQAGASSDALTSLGATTGFTSLGFGEVAGNQFATSGANAVQYVTVYDGASSTILRVARTMPVEISATPTSQNERFVSPGGVALFLPIIYVILNGSTPIPENRLWRSRFIGQGPMRSRDFQWVDNASNPKGFFVGCRGDSSDVSFTSLLNDDF